MLEALKDSIGRDQSAKDGKEKKKDVLKLALK